MPPRPLSIASARAYGPDSQALTPRTPRSRAGRVGEDYSEVKLSQSPHDTNSNDDDEYQEATHHQSVPLLASSRSATFPAVGHPNRDHDDYEDEPKRSAASGTLRRAREEDSKWSIHTLWTYFPLVVGGFLATCLLFLAFIAYERPDQINAYLGISVGSTANNVVNNTYHSHHAPPDHIISYENYTRFPLLAEEYRAECYRIHSGFMSHGGYWEPHSMGTMDVLHHDEQDDHVPQEGERRVCTSTITYMLDGKVGLFADLALLAQVAALARERNRTLLVDDTYWNRGKWLDYFQDVRVTQPGPEPGCRAPPPEELVACPRLARHWVVNSRTAKFHFGHEFTEAYEDPYAHELNRLKGIYKHARDSLKTSILPSSGGIALIARARSELLGSASPDASDKAQGYIAIHIRRGDRKPGFYNGDHVPAKDFIQAATESWARLNPEESAESLRIYLASDSPEADEEVLDLANTSSLFQSEIPELEALSSPQEYVQNEFDGLDGGSKKLATQGVIVDFALLTGLWVEQGDAVPDAVVCTLSSNICRLAAVGLGWERAFGAVDEMGQMDEEHKRWVEIDQKGRIVPVWTAFELF